jgi:hypothetical protein
MKTDRELLELAARAAGYVWDAYGIRGDGSWWTGSEYLEQWCPHDDDGDALRLAVKLGMEISLWGSSIHCKIGSIAFTQEPVGPDRAESVRAAIVKTAAKYAENKP